MSFDRFIASLRTPSLVEVAGHWNDARRGRPMPSWRDIDPAAIRLHLPIVWAWRHDPERMTFIGRLAGQAIVDAIGMQIRGRAIETCFAPEAAPLIRQRFELVLAGPRLMRSTGHVYINSGRHGTGERISLPLSDQGVRGDGIFGATAYAFDLPGHGGQKLEREVASEEVELFELSA